MKTQNFYKVGISGYRDLQLSQLREYKELLQNYLLNIKDRQKEKNFNTANSSKLIGKPSKYKDFQYRQIARQIVEMADEMIVMSDGVENDKIGGTSDIVSYAKSYATLTFTIWCDRLCA